MGHAADGLHGHGVPAAHRQRRNGRAARSNALGTSRPLISHAHALVLPAPHSLTPEVSSQVFPYHNIVPYDEFSFHMSKRQVPEIAARLRAVDNATRHRMHVALREHGRRGPNAGSLTATAHVSSRPERPLPCCRPLRSLTSADALPLTSCRYKRGFIWWRPEGLAYEYTLAALGERVASLGLVSANAAAKGRHREEFQYRS